MASVCNGSINNTIYQSIQDDVIQGACGSFGAFPDAGKAVLFQSPQGVGGGGCASSFINGVFFGGGDDTKFILDEMGVKVFVTSVMPTITNTAGEVSLGFNAQDGALILLLATVLIQTGFITLSTKRTTEVCLGFDQLPQLGGGPDVELSSTACADGTSGTAPGCTCGLFLNVNNGGPAARRFKFPNALVIGNTNVISAEASFAPLTDAAGLCFSALDLAAITGGGSGGCPPTSTACAASNLSDKLGLVQSVQLVISGLACVTLC